MENCDLLSRGERLKEERKRLGIKTQDELAELLGLTKNSIGRFEKHNDPMTTDHLDTLEDHGFDISYVLWGQRKDELKTVDLPEDEKRLLNLYRSIGNDAKKGLLLIAETYVQQSTK